MTQTLASSPGGAASAKLSYEQFLDRYDEHVHAEWVNGEVIPMAPISGEHQDVGHFLLVLLDHFVLANDAGVIRSEPFQMKTGANLPGRSPDVMVVLKEHLARLKKTYLEGPADLAVEIISPESRSRDRGEKFYEYEQGGVTEYWLIDPERKQAEFHVLGQNGIYRPAFVGSEGVYRSAVLQGLWIKVEWLWQRPLPLPVKVLKEWGLV